MVQVSQQMLVFGGLVVVVIVIITVFAAFIQPIKLETREKILIFESEQRKPVKITDVKPNTMHFFSYPSHLPASTDAYQMFLLIRLPEELGGGKNDVSSFRAYSAMDLESHCIMKYWPQDGRKRIEDPCHVGVYRPQDGLMITSNPILAGMFNGLPYLEISADKDGFLYVEPPIWEMDKNGVVGIGRTITQEYYREAAIKDLKEYTEQSQLEIPTHLTDGAFLTPGLGKNEFLYKNPNDITKIYQLKLLYCNCTDAALGEYYWHQKLRLGDDLINVVESGPSENKEHNYQIGFARDGYQIEFSVYDTFDNAMTLFLDNFFKRKNISMLENIP